MSKQHVVRMVTAALGAERVAAVRWARTSPDWTGLGHASGLELVRPGAWTPECQAELGGVLYSYRPQVVFLDPWHTLEASRAELRACWRALPDGGALVVHDCWPRYALADPEAVTAPDHRGPGVRWSGRTCEAWIDFVSDPLTGAWWRTVDTDYGVGVAVKHPGPPADPLAVAAWAARGPDALAALTYLAADPRLLRLTPLNRLQSELREVTT